jgi:hypothetical protein
MTATRVRLNQPAEGNGAPRTYFFNGRLLSAEDLKREQLLRENGQRQLAQLIGCGIAAGLEVSGSPASGLLSITGGLGVTPSGEVIDIGNTDLDLASVAEASRPGGFSTCAAAMANLESPSAGVYMLVLTPAWIGSGRAATLLGEVGACNRAVEHPAVRPRLLKVTVPANASTVTARNLVAHALLAAEDPGTSAERLVGWWPAAVVPTLGVDDLPIAVLCINPDPNLCWLDGPAARRRIAPPPGQASDSFWRESHRIEMEAFGAQFVAQATEFGAQIDAYLQLPPVALLDNSQLNQVDRLFKTTPAARASKSVGRAEFVQAMHEGLHDTTVGISDAQVTVLQLRGSTRCLIRVRHQADAERVPAASARNERSSKKLASLAGHALHDSDAEKRSLAASVLTQAPDKATRRTPRKSPPQA